MNLEQTRLNTFQTWPANAAVEPQRIAKAGFFYTGTGLEVECFSCGGRISEWNYGDQVMARHRQMNPECAFVKDPVSSGNIPVVNRSPSLYSQVSESNQNSLASASFQGSGDFSSAISQNLSARHTENVTSSDNIATSSETDNLNNLGSESAENSAQDSTDIPHSNTNLALYKSEATRLQSFASWPKSHIVSPRSLAKTGFFYLQDGDRVQCAFCSGKVHGWEQGDDPEMEHRRHFPSCPLHYNVGTGNIPLDSSSRNSESSDQASHSSYGIEEIEEIRPFSIQERGGSARLMSDNAQRDLNDLGIYSHRGPKHPKYSTIESRLRTFANWPTNLSQTPEQLAQAGFFYTGVNDQVRCFHCDGGLRQWDVNDEPWIEHARWFSKCTYVMLVKGDEFIQSAIDQHPPLLPADHLERTVNAPSHSRQEQPEYRVREVTEEELEGLLLTHPARVALGVGLDPSKIKQVLRRKMEQTGLPYMCSDALIEAVLDISSDTVSPEPSIEGAHSTIAERSEIPQQSVSRDAGLAQHSPLSVSKSLPSIAVVRTEPTLQGQNMKTQSMPRLSQKKKSLNMKTHLKGESSLEEENRRLKEARLCKICMDEEVGAVFVPCGHLATCVNCAASIQDCPMCRQPIKATVRTFLS